MTKEEETAITARHEAAHFVVHWAVGVPALHIDITPKARRDHGDWEEVGHTAARYLGPPLEEALAYLAGPVSDHWDKSADELLELKKDEIDRMVQEIVDTGEHSKKWDWNGCLKQLDCFGIYILDRKTLNDALLMCITSVRELLTLCDAEWKEVTEHLVRFGRLGYNGEFRDCGEGADVFFCRWEDDDGQPQKKEITDLVSKIRSKAERFKTTRE